MTVIPRFSIAAISLNLLLFAGRVLAQDFGDDKESMLEEINKFRKANGKKPVCMDPDASKLADAYAQTMISKNKLDHYADGMQPEQRYQSIKGYKSENLFQGSTVTKSDSASKAIKNGLNDHATKANMVDDAATHVGIGVAVKNEPGGNLYYWVQVFTASKPCDPDDKPKEPTMADKMNPPKVEEKQAPADPPPQPPTPPPSPPPIQAMPVMMMPVMPMPPPAPPSPPPKPEIPKKDQPYVPPEPRPKPAEKPEYKPIEPQLDMNPKPKTVPRTKSMPAAPPPKPAPPPNTCPCGPPADGGPNTPVSVPMPGAGPASPAQAPAFAFPMPAAMPPASPLTPPPSPLTPPPSPLQNPPPVPPSAAAPIAPGSTVSRQYIDPSAQAAIDTSSNTTMPVDLTKPAGAPSVYSPPSPARSLQPPQPI